MHGATVGPDHLAWGRGGEEADAEEAEEEEEEEEQERKSRTFTRGEEKEHGSQYLLRGPQIRIEFAAQTNESQHLPRGPQIRIEFAETYERITRQRSGLRTHTGNQHPPELNFSKIQKNCLRPDLAHS